MFLKKWDTHSKNISKKYTSKNISPVIQPVSDFPMPQPGGAALTKAAGILPYLKYCKVRGPFT